MKRQKLAIFNKIMEANTMVEVRFYCLCGETLILDIETYGEVGNDIVECEKCGYSCEIFLETTWRDEIGENKEEVDE